MKLAEWNGQWDFISTGYGMGMEVVNACIGSHGTELDGAFMFVTSEDRWEWNKNTNQ